MPAPGTYNPVDMFKTFDSLNKTSKESTGKSLGFGTDARFEYTRASKKQKEKGPGPMSYNTTFEWKKNPK